MIKKKPHRISTIDAAESNPPSSRRSPIQIIKDAALAISPASFLLTMLIFVLYDLLTGRRLTIEGMTLLYGKFLTVRDENVVMAIFGSSAALALLTYGIYCLRRGWMHNIIPGRLGSSRDRTRYKGLPMWAMFLSYFSLSVFLIEVAMTAVYYDKPISSHRVGWKEFFVDVENVPLLLTVAFYFVASSLDTAIGGREMSDVLAALRERFGRDSEGKKALLQKGISYDRKTFFEFIEEDDIEIVKLFLDAGMNINGVDPLNIWTPLSLAARNGHKELVKLFLERKADVNKKCPLWNTVYDFDDTTILRLLVNHNADIGVKNDDDETLLMRAAEALSLDTVKFLLEHDAEINAQTTDGRTALLYAVERTEYETEDDTDKEVQVIRKESYDIVKYLLERGADPNVKITPCESKNNTPLRIARSRKLKEVVELLEQYGARM